MNVIRNTVILLWILQRRCFRLFGLPFLTRVSSLSILSNSQIQPVCICFFSLFLQFSQYFYSYFFNGTTSFNNLYWSTPFSVRTFFFSFEYAYIPQFITVCLLNQAINAIVVSLRVYFSPKRVSKFDCHDNIQVLLVLSLSKCLLKV